MSGLTPPPGITIPLDRRGNPKEFLGMAPRWHITYQKDIRARLRHSQRLAKKTNLATIEHFRDTIFPRHFIPQAMQEYDYEKRLRITMLKKSERYGHQKPIVFKGFAESMLKFTAKLSSTSTTARMVARGPFYLGLRKEREIGGLSPDLKAELTAISEKDAKELLGFAKAKFQELFDADPGGTSKHKLGATP